MPTHASPRFHRVNILPPLLPLFFFFVKSQQDKDFQKITLPGASSHSTKLIVISSYHPLLSSCSICSGYIKHVCFGFFLPFFYANEDPKFTDCIWLIHPLRLFLICDTLPPASPSKSHESGEEAPSCHALPLAALSWRGSAG